MKKKIVIVGAGISGIMAAYVLRLFDLQVELIIIDAGSSPELGLHHGATLGPGRNTRHFTGTEGLSFQNPVHTKLLFEKTSDTSEGWQAIPEHELTQREKNWRKECVDRYVRDVTPEHNPYDVMYTKLNYGGMAAWEFLTEMQPQLGINQINKDHVYVAFADETSLLKDFASETLFNPFQDENPVAQVNLAQIHDNPAGVLAMDTIYSQLLQLPGSTWRIQSMWKYIYEFLSKDLLTKFIWDFSVKSTESLPKADAYVWANGCGCIVPDICKEYGRVQGIGGWWITVPNPGFRAPFKFSAPQPSGYINFTPDGDSLIISGGFGWIGERYYEEVEQLLEPARQHLLEDVSSLLKMSTDTFKKFNFEWCIRPTTPTGLPDIAIHTIGDAKHIMISGAGKAGSTQASILALFVAQQLVSDSKLQTTLENYNNQKNRKVIQSGLDLLNRGLEP